MTLDQAVGNARSSGYDRNADDWYVEPAACVDALLDVEQFTGPVWDPACGEGNVLRRCAARSIGANGSDIVDRGCGAVQQDFLAPLGLRRLGHDIICNPPFKDAQAFVERALVECEGKVAIVQRLAFLEGQKRREFFLRTGLSRVWIHSSRQSMPPGGSDLPAKGGSVAYAWFVWARTTPGAPFLGSFLP